MSGRVSTAPYTGVALVTTSDSASIALTKGIMIGGTGTIAVTMPGTPTPVTITGLAVGVIHPLAVNKVMTTNTSATNITAFY